MNKYYLKINGFEWPLFIKPKAFLLNGKESFELNPLTVNEILLPNEETINLKLRFSAFSGYPEYAFEIDSSAFVEKKINTIAINYKPGRWKRSVYYLAYRGLPIYAVLYLLIDFIKMDSYFKIAIGLLFVITMIANFFLKMYDKTSFTLSVNSLER
ncbi:MAG: hypothetical protein Q8904_10730 [Bacteroidota bacterium]|nr:hypothetical protein [Bacteroidota bacterium]